MSKKRYWLFLAFITIGFILASSNYQFEIVPAGTWETVEHIEGIQDLNFMPAAVGDDYVDATQSTTYGTIWTPPPQGMGTDDTLYTGLNEAGYTGGSDTDITSQPFTTSLSPWTTYTVNFDGFAWQSTGGQSGGWAGIVSGGQEDSGGGIRSDDYYYSSSQTLIEISWYWKKSATGQPYYMKVKDSGTNYDIVKTYAAATVQTTWASDSWSSSDTQYRHSGFDIEFECADCSDTAYVGVDTVVVTITYPLTYYRFQAVFRFNSVDYAYDKATLYIDFNTALTGSDDLDFRIGTGAAPTQVVKEDAQDDFNVDVSAYITAATIYLDIRDDYRTGDTVASEAWIQRCYLKIENTAPSTPTFGAIGNLVSGKVLAEYNYVTQTVTAVDVDGYANLGTVEYSMYNDLQTVEQWSILWTQSSDSFAEQDSAGNIVLGTCSSSLSGDTATLTFNYTIDFDFSVFLSTDMRAYSIDDSSSTATGWYTSGPGTETRLAFTGENIADASGTTNRGNVDGSLTASGTCIYYALTTSYPKDIDSFHIDVVCPDVAGSPWTETNYDESDGTFSVTVAADDVVGLDTYEFDAYQSAVERTWAAVTDTYIADQIQIQTTVSSDPQDRLNIDGNVEIRVTARLAYTTGGEIWLQAGDTLTLDDTAMSWDVTNSWFELSRSKASVGLWNYYVNSSSETEYGVTSLDLNSQNVEVIWDRIEIYSIVVNDDHIGAGTGVALTYLLRYDYLSQAGVTGTFYTDTTNDQLYYQAGNEWDATINEAVGSYIFNGFTSCSESQYGLTSWIFTGSQETVVFDTVRALAIQRSDDRCNYGTAQWVQVQFDYESAAYGYVATWSTYPTITGPNGIITLNQDIGSGWWRGSTGIYSSVARFDYNTNTLNDFIDVDSILARTKGSYTDYTIWDRIEIYSITYSDNHLGITSSMTLSYYLKYDYDDLAVSSGGTYSTDETADNLVYQSGNLWQATANEAGVGSIIFNGFTGCSDAGYSLTVWTFTGSQATITWDTVRALAIVVEDDRGNYGTAYYVQVTFDYESAAYGFVASWNTAPTITGPLGTVTLSSGQGSGVWRGASGTVSSVTRHDYNTNTLNDFIDVDNVLSRSKGAFTDYTIWDRIEFYSSAVDDSRINVNLNGWTSWLVRYDYDDAIITSGLTANLNGTKLLVWNATQSRWDYHEAKSSVQKVGYEILDASETQFTLTAWIQTAGDASIIWDRIEITATWILDIRCDYSSTQYVYVTATLDYDESEVGAGATMNLNSSAMTWDSVNLRWNKSYSYSQVANFSFYVSSAEDASHGITTLHNVTYVSITWDRVLVTLIAADGVYLDPDTQVNLTVSLEHEYDSTAITAGSFSLRYGSTYLTLTHDISSNWTVGDASSTPTSRTYDYVNGTASLYDITAINMNGKSVTVHWGRIILTVWINHHWRVVGYNTTIWYYGVFEGQGWTWNGTATFNGTGNNYPVESSSANYTFSVQSITDPDYGLTAFTANDVWCIFDGAESSSIAYYWVQHSVNEVWLVWMSGTWTWIINGTTLDTGAEDVCLIQSYMNATQDDWAIMDDTGQIGDLVVGAFNPSWYYVNLTANCETTINSTAYDWQIWGAILSVDILHSIHIQDSVIYLTDNYVTFGITTNWNNGSFTIWDNSTKVGYSLEGWYQIAKSSVIGLHNLTILINGTHGYADGVSQNKDFSQSDSWKWLNFKYTVTSVLDISNPSYSEADTECQLSGTTSIDCNAYVFSNNSYTGVSQVLTAGSFAVLWDKETAAGLHRWAVKFNTSSATEWVNGSYTVYAPDPEADLTITSWDINWYSSYITLSYVTNWENTTAKLYIDTVYDSEASEPDVLLYSLPTAPNTYNITFLIDGGTQSISRQYNYTVAAPSAEANLTINYWDISWLSYTVTINYQTNWENTTCKLYVNTVYHSEGSEPDTQSYTLPTAPNSYNLTWLIDGGGQSISKQYNYTITAPDPEAELALTVWDIEKGDYYWYVTWATNWANSTITPYEDGSPASGADENYTLQYEKATTEGNHTLDFKIDGGSGNIIWKNYTYAIISSAVEAEMRLAFFDSADNWVPFETLNVTLAYSGITYNLSSSVATVNVSAEFNLIVRGRWSELLHNSTFNYTQFKTIILTVFELIIDNEADHLVRLDISYNGTYPNITIMLPRNFPRFLYLASANYTLVFTYYAPATEGTLVDYNELTGYYVTYEYELLGTGYLKYTGISMADIQANIDYTRLTTNNNIDDVDVNVLAIPYPPNVPQNVVTPEDFWIIVLGFSAVAALFAVFGHGVKGWQIAKNTRITFHGDRNRSNDESYRDAGMPP